MYLRFSRKPPFNECTIKRYIEGTENSDKIFASEDKSRDNHIYMYFGKGYFLKGHIRRRRMLKRYVKYGLFLLLRDYLVVLETMMGNEFFMITIYRYTYAHVRTRTPQKT